MTETERAWIEQTPTGQLPVSWPSYPRITTTLLAAVGVAGIFLGLGTLTQQPWVTWVGLVVSAAVLASHVVRYRLARTKRSRIQQMLAAHLISECQRLGGPNFMQVYYDGLERVILVLTEDALLIYQNHPLRMFNAIALYNILDVQVGPVREPKWDEDHVGQLLDEDNVLNLAVQMSADSVYRLAFSQFERHVPAAKWAAALRRQIAIER